MKQSRVKIWVDGAARNNPGPAAVGVVIKDEDGQSISQISQCIGNTTNNQAEYRAVIAALTEAIRLGAEQVNLYSDSQLVVRQINGSYRVKKAELKPLHQQVIELQSQLARLDIRYIPRQQNREADSLANMALDWANKQK